MKKKPMLFVFIIFLLGALASFSFSYSFAEVTFCIQGQTLNEKKCNIAIYPSTWCSGFGSDCGGNSSTDDPPE